MVTKERLKNLHDLATKSNTPNWLEYVYLSCSQLEYHEALFMHYSMAIASTTRGEIINLQKAMLNELEIIELLKKEDSNNLCAYKLGVGKILIGQRGSGISSTLIDECLKYNRPLIVSSKHRAEQLSKQYPKLRLCFLIRDFNKNGYGIMNTSEDVINLDNEQVNIDLQVGYDISKDISEKVKEIKQIVGAIGTVGVSYDIEEEQPIWIPIANETPKVVENKPNKYVYAYTDFVEDKSVVTLIYFDGFNNFDGCDKINISNVRSVKNINEAVEVLFMANIMGYELLINNTMLGRDVYLRLKSLPINSSFEIKLIRPTRELNSNAYCKYSNSIGKISTTDKLSKEALGVFKDVKTIVKQGYITWSLERGDEREPLLKEILLAYYIITE